MRELFAAMARFASMDLSVLVHGETGTGKELVARAIHEASSRRAKPFVVVDCASMPRDLFESELFGHARGAFTGAADHRPGLIEAADGGTLFLDEIGELPLELQPKLLRVLESRTVRRVGEPSYRNVDIRVVAATHRDLAAMIANGSFREDLYFRLAVVPLSVPPLRLRRDDLPRLIAHFLPQATTQERERILRVVVARQWPGNVRELKNFVHRAFALGVEDAVEMSNAEEQGIQGAPDSASSGIDPAVFELAFRDFQEWAEREYVRQLADRHRGVVAKMAAAAAIDRTYVYRLLKKHSRNGARDTSE